MKQSSANFALLLSETGGRAKQMQVLNEEIAGALRRNPQFPGAVSVNSTDIQTLVHQTNQENPANAVLGKPAACQCRHGFPQAFSLDPILLSNNRLNSGLLKLTCPLLVNSIDLLEDEGFMEEINKMLQKQDSNGIKDAGDSTMTDFMNRAHKIHALSRQRLLSDSINAVKGREMIEEKLGKQGAQYFLDAGVAGVNPSKPDIKCLHAWMADYLFQSADNATSHPVGDLVKEALLKRGTDISGTYNCYMICSGVSSSITTLDGNVVSVPTPRNKQRKRTKKGTDRRRRLKNVCNA
jgi:hypothetical protein